MKNFILIALLTAGCAHSSPKFETKTLKVHKSGKSTWNLDEVVTGLGVIWGFAFLSEDEILTTERDGILRRIHLKKKTTQVISGVPDVADRGQGGLLDVALSPNFAKDQLIYLSYAVRLSGGYTTRVTRARLEDTKLTGAKHIFTAQPLFSTTHHYGSRITFDGKGHVFISVGDRGKRDRAQSLSSHNGKIIRLKEDGSVPKDNPFVDQKGALPEIWSYGHRNPQGLFFEKRTGTLWEHEHGPRGGDEINRIIRGKNYGWPIITHGKEYSGFTIGDGITKKAGMEQPKKYYVPSIAPSGLMVYSGKLESNWKGDLFLGAMAHRHLNHIQFKNGKPKETRFFRKLGERVRNVGEGPNGAIWFSTDSGQILRMSKPIRTSN